MGIDNIYIYIYIDKVGLGGLITFQEAEFEIADGHYFNKGRDHKINVTGNLYGLRFNIKAVNPAQVVIELLVDSMHGRTIIKPFDTIIKYSRGDFGKCISLNHSYIDSVLEVNVRYYINKLNQLWLILIMFIVGLKPYQCVNKV